MKLLLLFISLLLLTSSCENTEVVNAVLQAKINNTFYRALDAKIVENEDGTFLIQGVTGHESLSMKVANLELRTYDFGGTSANYASFERLNGDTYFTNPNGEGRVTISNYNEEAQTASGSFEFLAIIDGVDTIAVQNGIFYQAEIFNFLEDEIIIDPVMNVGTFLCSVDGNPFNPFNVSALLSTGFIEVKGYTGNKSITIKLPIDVVPGDYPLPETGFSAYYDDGEGLQDATLGNVIIFTHDAINNKVNGTFFFLTAAHAISLGQFNVIYE
ncbi:MAG: hypothetical protein ACI9M9_000789 [Flavobacteriaceae bacterium]|jgi:hypothetical protein